ncbi:MAG: DUF530 family protein, partial [Candidatus Diapherotrites archaeon]|nr:DUF530 family protein [Candidatus Diapherotrites archaeon]
MNIANFQGGDALALEDPFYVIVSSNEFMDKVAKEELRLSKLNPNELKQLKTKLEENVKSLKQLEEQMIHLKFDAPFAGLKDAYKALQTITPQTHGKEAYYEEITHIMDGLRGLKYQAHIKRVTLERNKMAKRAHEMAIQYTDELQNETPFDGRIADHLALGGEYAVKLERIGPFGRSAYSEVMEALSRIEEHTEAIVTFAYTVKAESIEDVERLPLDCNIQKELENKYGKNVDVLKIQLTGKKKGIIKDQFSRTNVAIAIAERISRKARDKTKHELKDTVNDDRLKDYAHIIARYEFEQEKDVNIHSLERLREELEEKDFIDKHGKIKQEIIQQKITKTQTGTKNHIQLARSLLAKELYLYYLTKSRKERSQASLYPGTKIDLTANDMTIFEPLQNKENEEFLNLVDFPLTTNAIQILTEKLEKENKDQVPAKQLGALILFNNTDLG